MSSCDSDLDAQRNGTSNRNRNGSQLSSRLSDQPRENSETTVRVSNEPRDAQVTLVDLLTSVPSSVEDLPRLPAQSIPIPEATDRAILVSTINSALQELEGLDALVRSDDHTDLLSTHSVPSIARNRPNGQHSEVTRRILQAHRPGWIRRPDNRPEDEGNQDSYRTREDENERTQ